MFRSKQSVPASGCCAIEALRQTFEVEFGQRIEFTELAELTRIKVVQTDLGGQELSRNVQGVYRSVGDPQPKEFTAEVWMDNGLSKVKRWVPTYAQFTVDDTPYRAHWVDHQGRDAVAVTPMKQVNSDVCARDHYNVGFGYAEGERWTETIHRVARTRA